MGLLLALVRRDIFEEDLRALELEGVPGEVLPWRTYGSRHRALDRLRPNDQLALVTVRPTGELLLVALYDDLRRSSDGQWTARTPNRTPVVDISDLQEALRFEDRRPLSGGGKSLAQSLQTPGRLTPDSESLVRARVHVGPPRVVAEASSDGDEHMEGEDIWSEQRRRKRDPVLTRSCLKRDRFTCQHCGFRRADIAAHIGPAMILHVHHLFPFRDKEGMRVTRLEDLVTLCPTCHSIVHALAAVHGVKSLSVELLRRYGPKPGPRSPTTT